MITTGSVPKALVGGSIRKGPSPAVDAMPHGVHQSLRDASQHKKQVSAVLHLKKEGGGAQTAYHVSKKMAFPQRGG